MNGVYQMDMTIEEYLAFETDLLKQAEEEGFVYDENQTEASD
jgi:hypothetical protein